MSGSEALICNAILIKNVWEIRARDQFQKQHNEATRVEKSALEKINQEWQSRMGDKYKPRKRKETKLPVPNAAPPKVRISVSKTRSPPELNRPGGLQFGRHHVEKKVSAKTDKLALLSLLKTSQPGGAMWSSSWKFSKEPGEGSNKPEGSEWGKAWKCINFQPQLDGKPWIEQEYTNADSGLNGEMSLWEKSHRLFDMEQSLENHMPSEWVSSWKCKKSSGKKEEVTSNGPMFGRMARLRHLEASQHKNEEKSSSEWIESWKSTKPSENGDVCFEAQSEEMHQQGNEDQSESKWGASWKYLNRQFHSVSNSPSKKSKSRGWADSWKVSKPVECDDEPSESKGFDVIDHEPLDPHIHGAIMPVSMADKYKYRSNKFREGETILAEWEKSWEGAKNMSILANVKPRKKVEPKVEEKKEEPKKVKESEPNGLPKRLEPKDRLAVRQKRAKPLSACDLSHEWNESWKIPRSQPKTDHWAKQTNSGVLNGPMVLQPHLKKRCLSDWKESWKCSRSRSSFGRPSSTEWKESSLMGYELRKGREQWMKEMGIDKYQGKSNKHEVFTLPKRGSRAETLFSIDTKDKYTFSPEWKESCHNIKHQIRNDVARPRSSRSHTFREPEKGETPVADWSNAWKFTNVTLHQDHGLWDQGWSSTENIRQDRWEREQEFFHEEVPHNGPTGFRGWGDSWRGTRRHHRVEGATAGQPSTHHQHRRRSPISGGWEDSWRVSSIQCRHTLHDRPSMREWSDSWEFSGVNSYERLEKSMEVIPRKSLHRVPRVGQVSRSFNPEVFKERVPPSDWKDSWRVGKFMRHHNRYSLKSKSHLSHPLHEVSDVKEWEKTWKFINLLSHQDQPLWDKGWETFELEKRPPVVKYVPPTEKEHGAKQSTEWAVSWRICGPQPEDWDDTPKVFHHKEKVLYSRRRSNDHLFAHLNTDALSQRLWGKSWRFMKLESILMPQISNTTSTKSSSSHAKSKTYKSKKHIYCDIEKSTPPPKRWTDATKLAKTQPRARRGPIKGKKADAEGISLEWVDSWKFSNASISSHVDKLSMSEWADSWKFLLGSYPPEKKGKSI